MAATPFPFPFSRRDFLSLSAAGLAAPLLSACGDGGSPAIFAGGSGAPPAEPDPESVQWLREGVRAALANPGSDVSAISVALFAGDRIVYREAFGYANRDTQRPATVETRFNIGSVSKVAAALAVMILRDRGLLSLDQPVAELLPSFSMISPEYTQVTVRHLISHSSGFPITNGNNAFSFAPVPGYAQDALEGLRRSRLNHAPGELAVYCNEGFTMVEPLVLELTGLSDPDFIR
jgi:CubicO group peptidase (beta-lactamase class C family)